MSLLNFLPFVSRKPHRRKTRGQRRPPPWRKSLAGLERLEDRTVPSPMITQAQSFGPGGTDLINQPLAPALQQFDTQGGYRVLDSVEIQVASSISSTLSGSITNNSRSQTATYHAQVT